MKIKNISCIRVSFIDERSSIIRRQLTYYDCTHKLYFVAMIPSDADRPINIQFEAGYVLKITDHSNNPNYGFIMGIIEFENETDLEINI